MRKILFIIGGDPRKSHRPAEAIRIATGAGAWGRVEVNICLTGTAALMLDENAEALRDEEQIAACLPALRESCRPVYVLGRSQNEISKAGVERLDVKALAELAMRHDVVVRF